MRTSIRHCSGCLGGAFMLLWGNRYAPNVVRRAMLCLCLSATPLMASDPIIPVESTHDPGLSGQAVTDSIDVDVLDDGTSSWRQRRAAAKELPVARLSLVNQQVVEGVLDNISLYRRLPVIRCEVDQPVLHFFTQNPDAAVSIWRAMGISEMKLTRLNRGQFRSDSGDGTDGVITLIHDTPTQKLIICDGMFKGPMLQKPIEARAMMHLRTRRSVDPRGREYNTCTADVFVSFPSTAIETVVRVIAPMTNRIADQNFKEVGMFLRMMQLAMDQQPGWIEQVTQQMDGVSDATKQSLLSTAASVHTGTRIASQPARLTPEGSRLLTPVEESGDTAPMTASGDDSSAEDPVMQ